MKSLSAAIAALTLFAAPPLAHAAVVTSNAALTVALKTAKVGDVIQARYSGPLTLRGLALPAAYTTGGQRVTVIVDFGASTFNQCRIDKVANLTLRNFELVPANLADYRPCSITNSSDVRVQKMHAHGSRSRGTGLYVFASKNVGVELSLFHDLALGGFCYQSDGCEILSNEFTDLTVDAWDLNAASHSAFNDNYCHAFHSGVGVHPDCLQLFTTGQTSDAVGLIAKRNLVWRDGGDRTQGVFPADQTGRHPTHGVVITDNVVIDEQSNGIYVSGVADYVVAANTVVLGDPTQYSAIKLVGGSPRTISANRAAVWTVDGKYKPAGFGFVQLAQPKDGGAALVAAWKAAHLVAAPNPY